MCLPCDCRSAPTLPQGLFCYVVCHDTIDIHRWTSSSITTGHYWLHTYHMVCPSALDIPAWDSRGTGRIGVVGQPRAHPLLMEPTAKPVRSAHGHHSGSLDICSIWGQSLQVLWNLEFGSIYVSPSRLHSSNFMHSDHSRKTPQPLQAVGES